MSLSRLLVLPGLFFLGGCLYHARERTDESVSALAAHPYDLLPPQPPQNAVAAPTSTATPPKQTEGTRQPALDIETAHYMEATSHAALPPPGPTKLEPLIPPEIPGSEAIPIRLPREEQAKQRAIQQLYPELPPLPAEPTALPGPEGRPVTLAELQQLAAANSPELRQAASDVEAARGALIQARAYPNPTVGWNVQPSNDGSTAGVQGPFIDQTIKFGGKLKLASAAAEMDLANAELALRRARSDLATRVRNAYFAVLVAKETVRVNKALARYTDEIYRLHTLLLQGAQPIAAYEPMALRALAYTARWAYQQSIQSYIYTWKQLVAVMGLRQLPLTELAGHIDAFIPYYDYDAVRAYALRNHTDVLTARNGIDKARYNLKLAQITPFPDVDFNVSLLKEYVLPPKQFVHTATIGLPFPIWDRNQGNIISAESALVRATEEPHRVEESLSSALATAYMGYKSNLDGLEHYRRYILPDQVRAYRGILARRQIDPGVAFADLLSAQQTLAADVTAYLGILGSLWSSVVSVADLLQTDDLFQMAQPRGVPPLPDLEPWPCCHPGPGAAPHGVIPAGAECVASAAGPVRLSPPAGRPASASEAIETLPILRSPVAPPAKETRPSIPLHLMAIPPAPHPAVLPAGPTTEAPGANEMRWNVPLHLIRATDTARPMEASAPAATGGLPSPAVGG